MIPRALVRSGEPVLEGEDHELHAVPQGELRQDAADMGLHGRLAEVLASGDLRVRQTPGREREDLPLAIGERGELRGHRLRLLGEVLEQLTGRGRGDDARPRVHGADRGEEELGVGVLEQESARPLTDGARGRLIEVEGCLLYTSDAADE